MSKTGKRERPMCYCIGHTRRTSLSKQFCFSSHRNYKHRHNVINILLCIYNYYIIFFKYFIVTIGKLVFKIKLIFFKNIFLIYINT